MTAFHPFVPIRHLMSKLLFQKARKPLGIHNHTLSPLLHHLLCSVHLCRPFVPTPTPKLLSLLQQHPPNPTTTPPPCCCCFTLCRCLWWFPNKQQVLPSLLSAKAVGSVYSPFGSVDIDVVFPSVGPPCLREHTWMEGQTQITLNCSHALRSPTVTLPPKHWLQNHSHPPYPLFPVCRPVEKGSTSSTRNEA